MLTAPNIHIQDGPGGFLTLSRNPNGPSPCTGNYVRIGVSEISIVVNGTTEKRLPKRKPQGEYTVLEIYDLMRELDRWVDVRKAAGQFVLGLGMCAHIDDHRRGYKE